MPETALVARFYSLFVCAVTCCPFSLQVFVRVYTSPAEIKLSASKQAYVWQSSGCDSWWLQPVGQVQEKGNNTKFMAAHGPQVPSMRWVLWLLVPGFTNWLCLGLGVWLWSVCLHVCGVWDGHVCVPVCSTLRIVGVLEICGMVLSSVVLVFWPCWVMIYTTATI